MRVEAFAHGDGISEPVTPEQQGPAGTRTTHGTVTPVLIGRSPRPGVRITRAVPRRDDRVGVARSSNDQCRRSPSAWAKCRNVASVGLAGFPVSGLLSVARGPGPFAPTRRPGSILPVDSIAILGVPAAACGVDCPGWFSASVPLCSLDTIRKIANTRD